MAIRVLQEEEFRNAAGLSRYVFDVCVRYRMEFLQTVWYIEPYLTEENLKTLHQQDKIVIWGVFEGEQLVAVSALQSDGMITMLYVLPQCQNRGYGHALINVMLDYAKEEYDFEKVTVNANPAWTSFYFKKQGFENANPNQNMHVPFVPMYFLLDEGKNYSKKPVPKKVIVLAVVGCLLFATIAGSIYMVSYLGL